MEGEKPVGARPWWRRRSGKIVVVLVSVVALVAVLDQIPPVRLAYQKLTMTEQERGELDSLLNQPRSGPDFERYVVGLWLRKAFHARKRTWSEKDDEARASLVRAASALPERHRRELYCGWLTAQADAVRDAVREADLAGIEVESDPLGYLGRAYERGRVADVRLTLDMERQRITDTGIVADLPIDHVLVDGWCEHCEAARWLAADERAPCLTADQLE